MIKGTLHEDQCTFFITSRSVLLRMRNVSDKSCRVIKTRILCSVTDFRKSCRVRDNVEKYCTAGRPQMAIWRMRIARWMPEAINAFRLCNTYCFSSVKKWLARTRLSFTLYVRCLSCLYLFCPLVRKSYDLPYTAHTTL